MNGTDNIPQIVSFSGGRTSAYLVHLMEQRRNAGEEVHYVYMDTGAEHKGTYEFIKKVAREWSINLVCLRVKVNPELGKANSYSVVPLDNIGPDLQPWKDVCEKYGTPYVHGAFCTRTMKTEVFERYCRDTFGQYHTWIGIRADEQRRLKPREGVSYLADISDFEKQDIIDWWKDQPFDLGIPEHLGNCVFCVKKGINKVALAARDEPELAAEFWNLITDPSVRIVERRQQENKIMYRGNNSLESIIAVFSDNTREDIAATIKGGGGYDPNSCTESCEALTCEVDEIAEQETESLEAQERQVSIRTGYGGSHTPAEQRDLWRTPPALFACLNAEFCFQLDAAAAAHNALCRKFITAEQNTLETPWDDYLSIPGYVWLNPPYSDITPFVKKAAAESTNQIGTVMLVPADTSVGWFKEAIQTASEVRFITAGRLAFINPVTGKPVSGNNKGSMLIIWHPYPRTHCHFSTVERDSLLNFGARLIAKREAA